MVMWGQILIFAPDSSSSVDIERVFPRESSFEDRRNAKIKI